MFKLLPWPESQESIIWLHPEVQKIAMRSAIGFELSYAAGCTGLLAWAIGGRYKTRFQRIPIALMFLPVMNIATMVVPHVYRHVAENNAYRRYPRKRK